MATLLDELSQIVSALNENEIEYALCGGLSMAIHGFARATLDIDVLIQQESLEKVFNVAAENSFAIHGLAIRLMKKPSSFGACRKLTIAAKCFRSICCWLRRKSKTFGRRGRRLIFSAKNFRSFRVKD
jgi:hypothetical protein